MCLNQSPEKVWGFLVMQATNHSMELGQLVVCMEPTVVDMQVFEDCGGSNNNVLMQGHNLVPGYNLWKVSKG